MIKLPCGLAIEQNAPLKSLTSWLVGGPAEYLAQPQTLEELREVMAWGHLSGLPVTLLGGGTNVLISDQGVPGLTIALRKLAGSVPGETIGEDGRRRFTLECLAGTGKSELLKALLKQKLEPALFLAGLPGDVGGGVVMNAGVGEKIQPREFVEITDWIEVISWPEGSSALSRPADESVSARGVSSHTRQSFKHSDSSIRELASSLKLDRIQARDLKWTYRHCEGWRPGVIARVGLSCPFEPKDDILARVKQANQVRLSKQPLDMPSCGSVFVNPEGTTSGRVIENAGLKGFAVGGAKVSEKHANFIVNFDNATALDIHNVIENVKATVLAKDGIQLKTEVVYLGKW